MRTAQLAMSFWHMGRFTDAEHQPAGIIGVMTDITEFRHVSEALESSGAAI